MIGRATLTVEEVSERFGVSAWSVRQTVARGGQPLGAIALRVGRRIVFPRARVDALLGIDSATRGRDGAPCLVSSREDGSGGH